LIRNEEACLKEQLHGGIFLLAIMGLKVDVYDRERSKMQ
jgi:hypothetical protein